MNNNIDDTKRMNAQSRQNKESQQSAGSSPSKTTKDSQQWDANFAANQNNSYASQPEIQMGRNAIAYSAMNESGPYANSVNTQSGTQPGTSKVNSSEGTAYQKSTQPNWKSSGSATNATDPDSTGDSPEEIRKANEKSRQNKGK